MSYPELKSQICTTLAHKQIKVFVSAILLFLTYGNILKAQCSQAGPNNGSSFTTDKTNGGVYNFSNPSNAQISDNNRANAISVAGIFTKKSYYLKATGFNFSIPSTATICGVAIDLERRAGSLLSTAVVDDDEVKLIKAGTIAGQNRATSPDWTGTDGYNTHGGSGDLWGTTLTPGDVNASNFGVTISAKITSLIGVAPSAEINHIRISVYYNVPLPVTLEYFNSTLEGNTAKLEWKMDYSDERNVTIQRSRDAITWQEIKTYQLSSIATATTFHYDDALVIAGKYYYRLMFTSITGEQECSLVKTINFESDKSISAFSIPSTSTVFLRGVEATRNIIVTDLSQRKIDIPVENLGSNLCSINISSLPRGMYFVQIGKSVLRIIKN